MKRKCLIFSLLGLFFFSFSFAGAQAEKKTQPQPKAPLPMYLLADAMGQRLTGNLQVKTIVGNPMKVGKVTLIPIMMIDIGFGGAEAELPRIRNSEAKDSL